MYTSCDDIIFITKTSDGLNNKLEQQRHTLKSRGFKLCRSKTKYFKHGFSQEEKGSEEVTIGGVAILGVEKFQYLGFIIQEKGDIKNDINQYIKGGWQK